MSRRMKTNLILLAGMVLPPLSYLFMSFDLGMALAAIPVLGSVSTTATSAATTPNILFFILSCLMKFPHITFLFYIPHFIQALSCLSNALLLCKTCVHNLDHLVYICL